MKLITFNTFLTPFFAKNIPGRIQWISDFLLNSQVDVICLQECFWGWRKLVKNLKRAYPYHSGRPKRRWNRLGNSGLLVLSKYPIEEIEFNSFEDLMYPDSLGNKGMLRIKTKGFEIINTHLQAFQSEQNKATRKLNMEQIKKTVGGNSLICGDFNINYWGDEFKVLLEKVKLDPGEEPQDQKYSFDPKLNGLASKSEEQGFLFDYGLSGKNIKIQQTRVLIPERELSDHFPVEITFTSAQEL